MSIYLPSFCAHFCLLELVLFFSFFLLFKYIFGRQNVWFIQSAALHTRHQRAESSTDTNHGRISHHCDAEIKSSPVLHFLFSIFRARPLSLLHRLWTNESFLSQQNHDSNLKCTPASSVTQTSGPDICVNNRNSTEADLKQIWIIPITVITQQQVFQFPRGHWNQIWYLEIPLQVNRSSDSRVSC